MSARLTRFCWPYTSTAPVYSFTNLSWSGTCTNAYWPRDMVTTPDIASPEIEVVELRSGLTARRFGHFIFDNVNCEVGFVNAYTHLNHWFYLHAPMDSVTIKNCELSITGSDSYDPVYVSQSSVAALTLPITITGMTWRNDLGDAYAALTASQVTLAGARTVTTDIGGLS